MAKAHVFPGQGSQFPGMGRDLYEQNESARTLFDQANALLGFRITDIMFEGTEDDLKQTRVTQLSVFLHSVILALTAPVPQPDCVAGHSLGELSALVICGAIRFEDALKLVDIRARAMQRCCEQVSGTMAAIIGLADEVIEDVCRQTPGTVVPANYNSPGQVVISGEKEAVAAACEALKAAGARRTLPLAVGGAFHSPLMEPAREELAAAIAATPFLRPFCPIYQNVTARAEMEPEAIQTNLVDQLTAPVRWSQTLHAMKVDGVDTFTEFGPGTVLQGLIRKTLGTESITIGGFSL